MKFVGVKSIGCFLFFLLVSSTAFGQQLIEGKIIDKETGKPIPFASVGIEGLPRGTSSNIDGEFYLSVPAIFTLRVTCLGYESATVRSTDDLRLIKLIPVAKQLDEIVILYKELNPRKIVRKAFASIRTNYNVHSFFQKFFYREYNKTDAIYERLVEASIDVWRPQGYSTLSGAAGEKEAMRINQLRRSLDIKGMVQGKAPISLNYILETDIAAYQTSKPSEHLKIFDNVSNLKTDFNHYNFTLSGITTYDGQEIFKIRYESKKDSLLTTTGYVDIPTVKGMLYITTDTYAFIKTEEVREDGVNTFRSSAYYLKHKDKYYPYHFIRETENNFISSHYFHVELMAVEIGESGSFAKNSLNRVDLLKIPYDSTYWNTSTILKTTPLENQIIHDLGGGLSLNKQFYLYKQYELNVTDGGKNGESKFNWLKADSKGKRILYLCFWDSHLSSLSNVIELEYVKRLNQIYKNKITFVMLSLETDEALWKQLVTKHNLFADGIINYRLGASSETVKNFKVTRAPSFILLSRNGDLFDVNARFPKDPLLEKDFQLLIEQAKEQ